MSIDSFRVLWIIRLGLFIGHGRGFIVSVQSHIVTLGTIPYSYLFKDLISSM